MNFNVWKKLFIMGSNMYILYSQNTYLHLYVTAHVQKFMSYTQPTFTCSQSIMATLHTLNLFKLTIKTPEPRQ